MGLSVPTIDFTTPTLSRIDRLLCLFRVSTYQVKHRIYIVQLFPVHLTWWSLQCLSHWFFSSLGAALLLWVPMLTRAWDDERLSLAMVAKVPYFPEPVSNKQAAAKGQIPMGWLNSRKGLVEVIIHCKRFSVQQEMFFLISHVNSISTASWTLPTSTPLETKIMMSCHIMWVPNLDRPWMVMSWWKCSEKHMFEK